MLLSGVDGAGNQQLESFAGRSVSCSPLYALAHKNSGLLSPLPPHIFFKSRLITSAD